MSYKTHKTYKPYKRSLALRAKTNSLREFVKDFDFANPTWENLPEGFPDCDTSGLTTKQDKHLYDAIKTAWIISGGGRQTFYKTATKRAAFGLAIVIMAGLIGKNLTAISGTSIAKNVSAKTVSEIFEATMSAVFR